MVTRGGPQPRTVEGGAEALNRSDGGHCRGEVVTLMDGIWDTYNGIMLITNI